MFFVSTNHNGNRTSSSYSFIVKSEILPTMVDNLAGNYVSPPSVESSFKEIFEPI